MSGVVVLRRVIPEERRRIRGDEFGLCSPGVITWLGRASMTRSKIAAAASTVAAVHLGAVIRVCCDVRELRAAVNAQEYTNAL